MTARVRRGSPCRLARRSISARVTGVRSTPPRLGALVLAEQVVERLAEQDGLLLLHALGQAAQAPELRGGVIGGLQDHVVARRERDAPAALVLRGVEGEVRLAHEVVWRLRVARRARDADAGGGGAVLDGLRDRRV